MQIVLPFKTPSINGLYWHKGNIKIMTREAREIRDKIKEIVGVPDVLEFYERPLKVNVDVYENWYLKDGVTVAKKDVANREKFLIDSIFKCLEIDDRYIFQSTFKKIQSETQEAAIVTIEVI